MGLRNFWVTGKLNPIASFCKYVWVETVRAVSGREKSPTFT